MYVSLDNLKTKMVEFKWDLDEFKPEDYMTIYTEGCNFFNER